MVRPRVLVLVALLGLAGVGAIGSCALADRLSRPVRAVVGLPPADFGGESIEISSDGGRVLRAWWRPGAPGKGAVLLLHPVRADRRAMLGRARLLAAQGMATLLVDLQAHGESDGKRITFGAREAEDARAAVSHLRKLEPTERIGAIGASLGGAALLLGPAASSVEVLVVEAVYPSIEEAIEERIALRLGRLPARLLAPLLVLQLGPRLGVTAAALRPIEAIARVGCPILVVAGELDEHTPLAQSQRLFDAAPEPKRLWVVSGARHEDLFSTVPEQWAEVVVPFVRDRISAPVPRMEVEDAPLRWSSAIEAPTRLAGSLALTPPIQARLRELGTSRLLLEATIDENGRMRDVRLLKPSDEPLERLLAPAFTAWRFAPARSNGEPVAVTYQMAVMVHWE